MRVSRLVTHADTVNAASSTTALLALPFKGLRPSSTFDFDFFFKVIFSSKFFSAIPSQTLTLGAGGGKFAKLKLKGMGRKPTTRGTFSLAAASTRGLGGLVAGVSCRSIASRPPEENYSKFFSANPSHVP